MLPNPIRSEDRKQCPNLEARSGRVRRWSADRARAGFYQAWRTVRYAKRFH
jgi:hypothetical protein